MLETPHIITSEQLVKEHIGSPEESWQHFESKISQTEATEIIKKHIEEAPEINPDDIEKIRRAQNVDIKTGSQAEFYSIPNRPGGLKWINNTDHRFTQQNIRAEEKEFQMQVLFYIAAEKWNDQNPNKKIHIPRPWSCLIRDSQDATPWIAMEKLSGETLFHLMFKHIIQKAFDSYQNENDIQPWENQSKAYPDLKNLDALIERQIDIEKLDKTSDEELIGVVQKILGLPDTQYIKDVAEKNHQQDKNRQRIYRAAHNLGFELDPEKIKNLREFIAFANHLGLYHRDLHAKNIFLVDDGNFGIIDFGTAELIENGDPYELHYLGDTFRLARDGEIFTLLNNITNKNSETEKMHKKYLLAQNDPAQLLLDEWPGDHNLMDIILLIKKRNIAKLANIADIFCQSDPYTNTQINQFATPGNFIKTIIQKDLLENTNYIEKLLKDLKSQLIAKKMLTPEEIATILTSFQKYVIMAKNIVHPSLRKGAIK